MTRLHLPLVLRWLLGAALVAHVVMFCWIVGGRFGFPFELEFMTGSVRDHIERVLRHEPVYVAPSAGFIPYLYPPLYYWLCAFLGGSVIVCRLISLVGTLVQLVAAHRIARALGASRTWALVASALFLACFPYVGFWYDLERCDSLMGGLVLLGTLLLVRRRGLGAHALAGAILGLAFFAKQQAAAYVVGAGIGLLASRRTKEGSPLAAIAAFSAAAVSVLGVVGALVVRRESEWFFYYCFRMPRAHGLMAFLVGNAFLPDLAMGFALMVGTCVFVGRAALAWRGREATRAELVFGAMLAAGFAGAVSSRLHIGGYVNVLIPWTTFASIAVAVLAGRLAATRWAPLANAIVLAQLVVWVHDPSRGVPHRRAAELDARFPVIVKELEKEGPVLIPPRGHLTEPRHFQIAALADVVRVDGHSPPDLVAALRAQRYVAILDDARPAGETPSTRWPPVLLEDIADLHAPLLESYFIAEWIDNDIIQTQLSSPALPHWIYRPRKTPLVAQSKDSLRARQLREMELALARSSALLRGEPVGFSADAIEQLADAR